MDEYSRRVDSQIRQYEAEQDIHDLPAIFHLWANSYLVLRMRAVFGTGGTAEFYAQSIAESFVKTGINRAVSIGAGDAATEIGIAAALRARGVAEFRIECLEISPILVDRANAKIREHALTEHLSATVCDINRWQPAAVYGAAMAHHSLHHIVGLEHAFAAVEAALAPEGYFITQDVIGRNGHMRWPETLAVIRHIWQELPIRCRYNHQLRRLEHEYDNWDCSAEGFEGIRAQDILPLCLDRFSFRRFLGWGGLVEVLIDRGFGPNFDPADPFDREIVRRTQLLEDRLIDQGCIKPTMMAAVMAKSAAAKPIVFRRRTPAFCLRPPDAAPPSLPVLDWHLPGHAAAGGARDLRLPGEPVSIDFGRASSAAGVKRSGWYPPEPETGGCWSRGGCATVALDRGDWPAPPPIWLDIELSPYIPRGGAQHIDVFVNGAAAAGWDFADATDAIRRKRIVVDAPGLAEGDLLIAFHIRWPRVPAADGGADVRPLGLLLRCLTITPASFGEPSAVEPAAAPAQLPPAGA